MIGRNGENINNIQSTCGVRLQFQNGVCVCVNAVGFDILLFTEVPGMEVRIATISGNPEACSRAHSMVMDIVHEVQHQMSSLVTYGDVILHGGITLHLLFD